MKRKTIWDPLRKKDVVLTPEEQVRQWFIHILTVHMQVPQHMMMSETGFRLGDKQYRADILVYDRQLQPLMIVECKRPDVTLDNDVLFQTIRYNMVLNVRYIAITNGQKTVIFSKTENGYVPMSEMPKYNEMLCQQ